MLQASAEAGLDEVVIGMAHRGRLNVLANIVGKPYEKIFTEFEGHLDPKSAQGSGDVKYHLGMTGKFTTPDGQHATTVSLAANPSHLEAVDPVLEGIVRAKQDRLDLGLEGYTVLPLLVHGDAAFAGQGVVAETLNLSQLRGYRTGGTVHVVVNNQVGFTTAPEYCRSSLYCTDVARMIQAPIFHVNGDDPEAVVRVARLAFEYRQAFNKDVVIDLVCYRRRGHNEGDDPSMTNPLMYQIIDTKRSVRKLYTEELIGRGDITVAEARGGAARLPAAAGDGVQGHPGRGLVARDDAARPASRRPSRPWRPRSAPSWCARIGEAHVNLPEGFTPHKRIQQLLDRRAKMAVEGDIDWGFGEIIAFGSLLAQGVTVRLSGQDSRRGTFVQRHAADRRRPDRRRTSCRSRRWPPTGARFHAHDSLLSRVRRDGLRVRLLRREPRRAGALGGAVRRLRQRRPVRHRRVHLLGRGQVGPAVVGDAAAAARPRGPGPRPHLGPPGALPAALRRGQHAGRHPDHPGQLLPPAAPPGAVAEAQAAGGLHAEVAAAAQARGLVGRPTSPPAPSSRSSARPRQLNPAEVKRVLLCSGKVYYDLVQARAERGITDTAIIRLEQLYPLPVEEVRAQLATYPNAEDFAWVQEEPANQGAWSFVALNLLEHLDGVRLRRISRPAAAAPAVGSAKLHDVEQSALLEAALPKLNG